MGLWAQLDAMVRAKRIELSPFSYEAVWNTLGAGATTPVTIPILADSKFVFDRVNLVSYTAAGVLDVAPDALITLFDSGSGRIFSDQPVHVLNLCNVSGMAQAQVVTFPEPFLLVGSSNFVVTLVNNTAIAKIIHVTLVGCKIFAYSGYDRSVSGI